MFRIYFALLILASFQYAASIEITCKFYGYDWNNWGNQYTCSAKMNKVLTENVAVTSVVGNHKPDHSNDDVKGVEIHGQTTCYLVHGLINFFHNLEQIYIFRSDLKHLSRSDFKQYTQLRTISLSRNHLSILPFDTFEDLVDLEYFSLSFNQLTTIPNLKTLLKLKELYLFENSIESLSSKEFLFNPNLEIIWLYHNKLQNIEPDVFDSLPKLRTVDMSNNICIDYKFTRFNAEVMQYMIKENCATQPKTDYEAVSTYVGANTI